MMMKNRLHKCGAFGVILFLCSMQSVASLPIPEDLQVDIQASDEALTSASKIDDQECLAASVCLTWDTEKRARWKLASWELVVEVRKKGTKATLLAKTLPGAGLSVQVLLPKASNRNAYSETLRCSNFTGLTAGCCQGDEWRQVVDAISNVGAACAHGRARTGRQKHRAGIGKVLTNACLTHA